MPLPYFCFKFVFLIITKILIEYLFDQTQTLNCGGSSYSQRESIIVHFIMVVVVNQFSSQTFQNELIYLVICKYILHIIKIRNHN